MWGTGLHRLKEEERETDKHQDSEVLLGRHWKYGECNQTKDLKMVKIVNIMSCIFYYRNNRLYFSPRNHIQFHMRKRLIMLLKLEE